ncbi:MAG: hypothetical protein PHE15_05625 [Dehalococcoidales bacterium]|nr:hypothetical protein [Dehalococcoidales bacterium]
MKALSLQEPYAWLIVQRAYEDSPGKPIKDVENRHWPLPKNFTVPQRIYVHASLTMYDVSLQEIRGQMGAMQWLRQRDALHSMYSLWETYKSRREELKKFRYFGHIIGEVDITGCQFRFGEENDNLYSHWAIPGQYGFKLANPVLFDKPIPYRGQQGFFEVKLPTSA